MLVASRVLMVRPAAFGYSEQAAGSNVFQRRSALDAAAVAEAAVAEFDGAVAALRAGGVEVTVVDDTATPPKPDAVFPNNWVSWMPVDGAPRGVGVGASREAGAARVVLYPMAVPSRRAERRADIVAEVSGAASTVLDFSPMEAEGEYCEGTGSLVFDHVARVAYACRSPRTTEPAVRAICAALGYEPVLFDAALDGAAVYHTNVVLGLGPDWAVWFAAGAGAGRAAVEAALRASGRAILPLTAEQVRAYCGNVLALQPGTGDGVSTGRPTASITVLSTTAARAFHPDELERIGPALPLHIPTIEQVGGGSARCLLAEVR